MSEMFEDIEGVYIVVDDLLIRGDTGEQHDSRLERVTKSKASQSEAKQR